MLALLTETHARAAAGDPSLTLDALADVCERLRTVYRAEYVLYDLGGLLGPVLVPPMRALLAQWDPLSDPVGPAAAMRGWRGLLRLDKPAPPRAGAAAAAAMDESSVRSSFFWGGRWGGGGREEGEK